MADTEYERRASQDYIDQRPTRYDASSGWGVVIGVIALVAILAMLFIGFGSGGRDTTTTNTPAVEKTTPPATVEKTTPPATQGPTTRPANPPANQGPTTQPAPATPK